MDRLLDKSNFTEKRSFVQVFFKKIFLLLNRKYGGYNYVAVHLNKNEV